MEVLQYYDLYKYSDYDLITWYKGSKDTCYIDELYRRYYDMFRKFSKKYCKFNKLYQFDDLMQECYFTFIKILEWYDCEKERKASFTTVLFNNLNRDLATVVNGRTSKSRGNFELFNSCTSLDNIIPGTDDCKLEDTIEDINADDTPERLFIEDLRVKEIAAMNNLTLREKVIVKSRNAFDSQLMTLQEIGDMFNKSKERIRQIESSAIRKLRNNDELIRIWNEEYGTREYRKVVKKEKKHIYDKDDYRYYLFHFR